MNPCPCGYFNSSLKQCGCTPPLIQRYLAKISGPLLDRIDLHIDVPEVKYKELTSAQRGEPSKVIEARVSRARDVQLGRFCDTTIFCNAQMGPKEISRYCQLDDAARSTLEGAIQRLGFSARAYDRVLKVARTIADLEGAESIRQSDVSEAIQYRSLDRNYWDNL